MIPIAEPDLQGNEARYLADCISSSYISSVGPFVDRLEDAIVLATKSRAAVAVQSGTAGLHLALSACDVRSGDLVISPTFTFIATANAISHCGAEPWLFDVDDSSWTLDPRLVERELQEKCSPGPRGPILRATGQRVAALLPVHTLGLPADMDPLIQVSKEFNIPLVADAAAAIGASYQGRPLGTLADVSVASFNGNKTITCGGGGALFGPNQDILHRARHLSTVARVGKDYTHDAIGFNYRMTNLQAAVGCAQFERLPELLGRKAEIRNLYDEYAKSTNGIIQAFPSPQWAHSANWLSGFVLPTKEENARVIEQLQRCGIGARSFWKPIHLQTPYLAAPRTCCEVSESIWNRILTLPSSTSLTDEDIANVLRTFDLVIRSS